MQIEERRKCPVICIHFTEVQARACRTAALEVMWLMAALKRREPEVPQWWGEKLCCLEKDSAATCSS